MVAARSLWLNIAFGGKVSVRIGICGLGIRTSMLLKPLQHMNKLPRLGRACPGRTLTKIRPEEFNMGADHALLWEKMDDCRDDSLLAACIVFSFASSILESFAPVIIRDI